VEASLDIDQLDRAARKRRAILDAARAVFLRNGYLGTSMDEVASVAAVSKATVYKYFADKESLFSEMVRTTLDAASDPNYEDVMRLGDTDELETGLREFARRQLERVMQPQILQMRRLVIGEASRFPALGRVFYERGAGRTLDALATVFGSLAERGLLELADPALAAAQFNWLIMSLPVNRAMLTGEDRGPSKAELGRYVDSGVEVFLAAYGARRAS
jgi:TetR/AcrR family transcriptional regulator, mexJK operon transcriptional repressor